MLTRATPFEPSALAPLAVGELSCCEVFGRELGSGNPTTVVRLPHWPAAQKLQQLAAYFGTTESTFVVADPSRAELRWFAGEREVPLCGHGALAAAHVLAGLFQGASTPVSNKPEQLWLEQDATGPGIALAPIQLRRCEIPRPLADLRVREAWDAGRDYLVVLEDEASLRAIDPLRAGIEQLDKIGLIATAPGVDAIAAFRFFAPRAGIVEDDASASVLPGLVARWHGGQAGEVSFRQLSRKNVLLRARCAESRVAVRGDVMVLARGRLQALKELQ